MNPTTKLAALGAFLVLGAIASVLIMGERFWPAPLGTIGAAVAANLFVAYAMFMAALFASYYMPVKNRPFAIFGILASASFLMLGVTSFLPDSVHRVIVDAITISLFVTLTGYSVIWGAWGLISGAIAFWQKPPPRLNGWHRMGILASVAWTVGALAYTGSQPLRPQVELSACLEFETSRPSNEPMDAKRCVERHMIDYPIAAAERTQRAMLNALVPPMLGWFFIYIALAAVSWVREGFRTVRPQ